MKRSVLQMMAMLFALLAFQGCNKTKDTPTPAPGITTFAPASGAAGTPVTITGSNFGATTDKNIVTFAGTPATVTAATATQLTVTVPAGAATGKITVSVGSATATSATDFTIVLPPTVTNFAPTSALAGASVIITGTNFSTTLTDNVVKFNGTAATVTAATATQLTVTVPAGATSGKITVGAVSSATDFTVLLPTITNFTPASGAVGTTVVINGTNFSTTLTDNVVKFNGTVAAVTQATATQLTVTVPVGASTGKVSVGNVLSSTDFTIILPVSITSLSAVSGAIGKTIVITGENFEAIAANNLVKFNLTPAVVTAATTTQLTVEVPYGTSTGPLSVKVSNGSTAEKFFNIVSAWTQKTDSPVSRADGFSFSIGGKGYVGGGLNAASNAFLNDFYIFDPAGTGSWTVKQSLATPANVELEGLGFAIGDKGYVVATSNKGDIYQYNPSTDAWANYMNAGFTSTNTSHFWSAFAINNKGYIINGITFIEFDPAGNGGNGSVTSLPDYPASGGAIRENAFVISGVAYVGGGVAGGPATKFYKYTPGGTWTALSDAPISTNTTTDLSAFSIGQYGYIINKNQVHRYNPANDSWTRLEDVPSTSVIYERPAFVIGQKGYLSTGGFDYIGGGPVGLATVDTWEYDPSK